MFPLSRFLASSSVTAVGGCLVLYAPATTLTCSVRFLIIRLRTVHPTAVCSLALPTEASDWRILASVLMLSTVSRAMLTPCVGNRCNYRIIARVVRVVNCLYTGLQFMALRDVL